MRAAVWLRASKDEQSTANQRPALEAMAAARGDEIAVVFDIHASASAGHHRGQWAQVVRLCHQGRVKAVYIWALDRVSREGVEAMFTALGRVWRTGAVVHSYQEPWLSDEAMDARDVLIAVAAWTAQREAGRISERTKAGLARVSANGKTLGRPKGAKDKKKRVSRTRANGRLGGHDVLMVE